jgi:hypothetical protein
MVQGKVIMAQKVRGYGIHEDKEKREKKGIIENSEQ